ncbi:MAG: transposase [Kiritimatiellaeota bacterium]|nr:transposase [Kiritimatiellota bacterium]
MKRRVKWIKQSKNGKIYTQPWIGYSYRNKNGVSDFRRETSLNTLSKQEVDDIDAALRHVGDAGAGTPAVQFLDSQEIGAWWVARRVAEKLGIVDELAQFGEKHRNALLAMILDRVVQPLPHSKLSLWESLPDSPLERVVAPEGIHIELHDIHKSLETLLHAQKEIQRKLYEKRSTVDNMYLYDITSSYFEGDSRALAKYGYNRDGKKGKKQIVIGLLTDSDGRPLAIEVFEGNTSDQTTVMDKINDMREEYNIDEMIFIGDRGMVTRTRREDLQKKEYECIDGFYVITSDVGKETLDAKELSERYKSLIQVEQAFRTMKTTDIFVRPIRHWNPERVKGHVFLCMLAYLVIWEARRVFADFMSREQIDEATRREENHSLRTLWERLNKDVKIGKMRIKGKIEEQIKPMKQKTKQMLKAADATFTKKRMEQLMIVGKRLKNYS